MVEAMTTRTRLSVLLVSTPLLAFIVFGGMGKASGGDQTFQHLRVFEDVVSLILNNYVEDAKVDKVMEGAMRGLADGLDPDSAYLTAAEVKSIEPGEKLPPGDVGIELTRQVLSARDRGARRFARREGRPADGRLRPRDRRQAGARPVGLRGHAAAPRHARLQGHADGHPRQRRRTAPDRARPREDAGRGRDGQDARRPISATSASPRSARTPPRRSARRPTPWSKSGAKELIVDIRHTAEGPFETGLDAARVFVKSGTLAMIAGRDETKKASEPDDPPRRGAAQPPAAADAARPSRRRPRSRKRSPRSPATAPSRCR